MLTGTSGPLRSPTLGWHADVGGSHYQHTLVTASDAILTWVAAERKFRLCCPSVGLCLLGGRIFSHSLMHVITVLVEDRILCGVDECLINQLTLVKGSCRIFFLNYLGGRHHLVEFQAWYALFLSFVWLGVSLSTFIAWQGYHINFLAWWSRCKCILVLGQQGEEEIGLADSRALAVEQTQKQQSRYI